MRNYFIAAICLLSAAACKRNFDQTGVAPNIRPRLARIYELDTTRSAPNDTISRQYITYDALGRTASITKIRTSTPTDTTLFVKQNFDYSGADSMASRSILFTKITGSNPVLRWDTTWQHFANGRLQADSSISVSASGDADVRVRRRFFSGGRITDSTRLVSIRNGVADTVWQERRIWTSAVGPYLLSQTDSTSIVDNSGSLSYSAFAANMNPTVIPNPLFDLYRPVLDDVQDGADSGPFPSFWTPRYLVDLMTLSSSHWLSNTAPVADPLRTLRQRYSTRNDGYPVRMHETVSAGTSSKTTHYFFVYQ